MQNSNPQKENPLFERQWMKWENVGGVGMLILSAHLINNNVENNINSPLSWFLSLMPILVHVIAYNVLKISYDVKTEKNDGETINNLSLLKLLYMPFIGPIRDRFTLPKKS